MLKAHPKWWVISLYVKLHCNTAEIYRHKSLGNSWVRVKIQPWLKDFSPLLWITVLLLECLEADLLSVSALNLTSSIQWRRMASGDCGRASKRQLWWEMLTHRAHQMNHAVKENHLLHSQCGQGGAIADRPKACDGFQRHFPFIISNWYLWSSRYFGLVTY